jgi:DNA helicase-2/ATP-dependent DNA helicase PcrA
MTIERFLEAVPAAIGRPLNDRQRQCIRHPDATPLMIVAGPGTGKTTVLVLRALRHVLVDNMLPEHVLITTFTKKAAREITSRLIEWGGRLLEVAVTLPGADADQLAFLERIDINRFVTGTLDSICEDAVAEARTVDERPPVVIEPFAANQWLARYGDVYEEGRDAAVALGAFLAPYRGRRRPLQSLGDLTAAVRLFADRFVQDRVDLDAFLRGPDLPQKQAIVRIYNRYRDGMAADNRLDFPALEKRVLDVLERAAPPPMLAQIRAVLVDEYQDTNPLQEALYFSLVCATGASLSVVGDDDQSLYRFRGATMELFRNFAQRSERTCGLPVDTVYLVENYRSVPEVVTFFNDFVEVDPSFALARVQPPKPRIVETRTSEGIPVLGLFRPSAETLADDLASLLHDVFRGDGWTHPTKPDIRIQANPQGGDFGDSVLLSHSVQELDRADEFNRDAQPKALLPLLLRRSLERRGVGVFNPAGEKLRNVPLVERLLGLVLDSLDYRVIEVDDGANLTSDAKRAFPRWRAAARQFIANDPRSAKNEPLQPLVDRWRSVVRNGRDTFLANAREWPALDVMYSFLPWLPQFQDDPEHQIYLEAISRCAAVAATYSTYTANIVQSEEHRRRSADRILKDIMQPIAQDLVEVDEDIMPAVPRDRLSIMTIHQAKGLEFPLVIVNVGMYAMDAAANRFRRFPDSVSQTAMLEDYLAASTEIGEARRQRLAIDRSFDDLVRLYYVAYSRPQSVLLLVGHAKCLDYSKAPKNVATWWRRNSTWAWREPQLERQAVPPDGTRRARGLVVPVIADVIPFELIENAP